MQIFAVVRMLACPFCESAVGRQVAQGVATEFWTTAAAVFAPIPAMAAVVILVWFGPWFRGVHDD